MFLWLKCLPLKLGDLSLSPRIYIKNAECGGMLLESSPEPGRGRRVLRVNWTVSLAYLVSYRPMRNSFLRGVEKCPKDDIRHCLMCLHGHTICVYLHTHNPPSHTHLHTLKENCVETFFYTVCERYLC